MRATAASLMGDPAPGLGTLQDLSPDDVQAIERERSRLERKWGMLHTSGKTTHSKKKNVVFT